MGWDHTNGTVNTRRGREIQPSTAQTRPRPERLQPCHRETKAVTPTSRNARRTISKKATKRRASEKKKPRDGPGGPSTSRPEAERKDPRPRGPELPPRRLCFVATVRTGISGWTYPPWRGTFFPDGLVQRGELAYASRQVSSIEINGTFYSLQRPASYGAWSAQTPAGFVFAVKAPRFITHILRLREIATPVANFFASGVLRLGRKLGPILWQLPPSLPYDASVLEAFLAGLP